MQLRKHRDKNQIVQESSRGFARFPAGESFCGNETDVEEGEAFTSKREGEPPKPRGASLAALC